MPETTLFPGALGTLLLGLTVVLTIGGIEIVARLLAPPPEKDPRLGLLAFWVCAAVAAATSPVVVPLLDRPHNWLDRMVAVVFYGVWVASKAGFLAAGEDDRALEAREEGKAWALGTGLVLGLLFVAPHWRLPL